MMRSFKTCLASAVLAAALFAPAWAGAPAERSLTLTFPTRTIEATVDAAALVKATAAFQPGREEITSSDASGFLKSIGEAEPLLSGGRAVLVAVEYKAGDPTERDLAYARARSLRSVLVGGVKGLSSDRVVIAALAGNPASARFATVVFAPLSLGSDGKADGGDPVRAVALDSAYIGPVYADLAGGLPEAKPTEVAKAEGSAAPSKAEGPKPSATASSAGATPSQPESTEVAPAPAETPPSRPEAKTPSPSAQAFAPAPLPGDAEAGRTSEQASADLRYTVTWCPRPARILDDFYPGGPIVPCVRPRN